MREFLFVDDMADAVVFSIENEMPDHLYNVGSGIDITIKDLAETVQNIVGHKGKIEWDLNKPDGTPKKLLDVSKMNKLGWRYSTDLVEGITKTYEWFLKNIENIREIKL